MDTSWIQLLVTICSCILGTSSQFYDFQALTMIQPSSYRTAPTGQPVTTQMVEVPLYFLMPESAAESQSTMHPSMSVVTHNNPPGYDIVKLNEHASYSQNDGNTYSKNEYIVDSDPYAIYINGVEAPEVRENTQRLYSSELPLGSLQEKSNNQIFYSAQSLEPLPHSALTYSTLIGGQGQQFYPHDQEMSYVQPYVSYNTNSLMSDAQQYIQLPAPAPAPVPPPLPQQQPPASQVYNSVLPNNNMYVPAQQEPLTNILPPAHIIPHSSVLQQGNVAPPPARQHKHHAAFQQPYTSHPPAIHPGPMVHNGGNAMTSLHSLLGTLIDALKQTQKHQPPQQMIHHLPVPMMHRLANRRPARRARPIISNFYEKMLQKPRRRRRRKNQSPIYKRIFKALGKSDAMGKGSERQVSVLGEDISGNEYFDFEIGDEDNSEYVVDESGNDYYSDDEEY